MENSTKEKCSTLSLLMVIYGKDLQLNGRAGYSDWNQVLENPKIQNKRRTSGAKANTELETTGVYETELLEVWYGLWRHWWKIVY